MVTKRMDFKRVAINKMDAQFVVRFNKIGNYVRIHER